MCVANIGLFRWEGSTLKHLSCISLTIFFLPSSYSLFTTTNLGRVTWSLPQPPPVLASSQLNHTSSGRPRLPSSRVRTASDLANGQSQVRPSLASHLSGPPFSPTPKHKLLCESHFCPFGIPSALPPTLPLPAFYLPASLDHRHGCLGICVSAPAVPSV